jgi:uncharacterized protein with PIN domain
MRYFDEFHICADCSRIYWKGSHYHALQVLVERVQLTAA